ncbi:energy transducer TonB [Pontibacter brevis]
MKVIAFLILMATAPLSGYCQKKVTFKHNITYDTAHLRDLDKNIQLDYSDSSKVYFDDSEFCIKFKGGDKALVKYFVDSFQLADNVKDDSISGKVLASFTINEKGEVGDVKIVEGLVDEIDNEVKRVISAMPKWIWDCDYKPKRPVKTKRFAPFIIE